MRTLVRFLLRPFSSLPVNLFTGLNRSDLIFRSLVLPIQLSRCVPPACGKP